LDRKIADLWAVTVHDSEIPSFLEQVEQAPRHGRRVGRLLRVRSRLPLDGERVPAQGDHGYLGHGASPCLHDDPCGLPAGGRSFIMRRKFGR
jgi:hypothetical protein